METYIAIHLFAQSLKEFLSRPLKQALGEQVSVTLDSPKKIQDEGRVESNLLSLYIYRIVENADLRNSISYRDSDSKTTTRVIGLDIHFLLTAYGPDMLKILGYTQFVLHNTVLAGSLVSENENPSDLNIKITQQPLSQELITQMWQAMECSMRLALYYLATPVTIDFSTTDNTASVKNHRVGKS